MLASFGGMENGLAAAPTLLAAGDLLERGRVVVIAGEAPQEASGLLAVALAAQAPDLVVLRAGDRDAPVLHPAHGKLAGGPAAYLCSGGVCGLPIRDPAALAAALGG
jgi:uncharacterized protein YyaL (SSP411 family)